MQRHERQTEPGYRNYWDAMTEPSPSKSKPPADPRTEQRSALHAFVRRRDGVEVCTLYPPTVIVPHQTDAWLRATRDSFRSLDDCR